MKLPINPNPNKSNISEDLKKAVGENCIELAYDCGCRYYMTNRVLSELVGKMNDDGAIVWQFCRYHTEEYNDQVNYRK